MNLKSSIFAVVFAIGICISNANAQDGPPPADMPMVVPLPLTADGVKPYISMHLYAGEVYYNKDYRKNKAFQDAFFDSISANPADPVGATAAGNAAADKAKAHHTFLLNPSPSGNSKIGLIGKIGNLYAEGSVSAVWNPKDYTVSPDILVNAKYVIDGFFIQAGRFAVPFGAMPNIYDVVLDGGMINEASSSTLPQWQFIINYKGFYIDAMPVGDVATSLQTQQGGLPKFAGVVDKTQVDGTIPKIAVGYLTPGLGPVIFRTSFIYQNAKIDYEDKTKTTNYTGVDGKRITAWNANAAVETRLGPVTIHLTGFYSQNQGDLGLGSWTNTRAVINFRGDKITNTTGGGGNAGIAYTVGKLTFAVGGAYEIFDNDLFVKKDDTKVYFASVNYMATPNCIISPGFKYFDYGKSTGIHDSTIPGPPGANTDVQPMKEGTEMHFGILFTTFVI